MPKIPPPQSDRKIITYPLELVSIAVAEREAFVSAFKRIESGNLVSYDGDRTFTVFRRNGGYRWCIAKQGRPPRYSFEGFEAEEDALDAFAHELGVGEI